MILIDSAEALQVLGRQLEGIPGVGIDTEGNSFYSYRDRTCLVQISSPDEDYLIDPLAVPDLSPLAPLFADVETVKVYHAADNDVAALRRDFGLHTHRLFDTMTASRILGLAKYGLGDLLREFFGVESDKRMQRFDWGSRPLPQEAIAYAAMDTRYLLPLRDILQQRLQSVDREQEAEEEFVRLEGATAAAREFDPESFWRIKGAYELDPRGRALLRELHIWRDRRARASDRPPFRVIPDAVLVAIARRQPQTLLELGEVEGLSPGLARRFGPALLDSARRAAGAQPPREPQSVRRPDDVVARYEALRAWRRQVAAQRGVEPDVITANAVLSALAERPPRSEEQLSELGLLGPWKLRAYGPDLLRVLRQG